MQNLCTSLWRCNNGNKCKWWCNKLLESLLLFFDKHCVSFDNCTNPLCCSAARAPFCCFFWHTAPSNEVTALAVDSHLMTLLNLPGIVWILEMHYIQHALLSCFLSTGRSSTQWQSESAPALNGTSTTNHKVSRHTSANMNKPCQKGITHWGFQENKILHRLSHACSNSTECSRKQAIVRIFSSNILKTVGGNKTITVNRTRFVLNTHS